MSLQHILSRSGEVEIDLEDYRADELKKAARVWVGKEAAKFHKQQSISALKRVFGQKTSAKKVVAGLSDKQKRVLEIFARYGPVVSGPLLSVEVQQRGLVEAADKSRGAYYDRRHNDLVYALRDKLVLVHRGYDPYYYSSFERRYPTLTLHPTLAKAVEPAEPMPWEPSEKAPTVKAWSARSSAQPALDLWRVAEALRTMGDWKTVKGDALSKGSRNKLRRMVALPSAEDDFLSPPDPESLFYELLREMGFLSLAVEPRQVLIVRLQQHFDTPAVAQAWCWLRAWLDIRLWQDGIGVVPDRDNRYEPVRIDPDSLRHAKELLIWAFCRLAHSPCDWLDLEVFLKDFWRATHDAGADFYWHGYTWDPGFAMARSKDRFPAGPDRRLAFWLDDEGAWAANAILVTFVALGLIQRGETSGKKRRPCFRLTDLGRQVFGTPETAAATRPNEEPFLTVQPNHEILAYLDAADARRICTLARFAEHGKHSGGHVQTFSLSRQSVYAALEDGMTVEEIRAFLVEHGKTELPVNVARVLGEWSGRRESLVLRRGVTVALATRAGVISKLGSQAKKLGPTSAFLKNTSTKKATKDFPGWSVINHRAELPRVWSVDELGRLQSSGEDTVASVRLTCIADQILDWLSAHLSRQTPPLLVTAIRNWTGRVSAFAGKVHLLQITRPEACDAILGSHVFRPLLTGHIPPCWFLVRDDKAAEVKRLLKRLGFRIDTSYQAASLEDTRQSESGPRIPAKRTRRKRR